jgi:hypothetical protein
MMPLNLKVIKLWTFARSYKPYGMQPNEKLLLNSFTKNILKGNTSLKIFQINNKNVLKEEL